MIYVNTEGRVQMTSRAAFPPGDAREDWAILRALSDTLGHKLPYDSLGALRQALYADHPHLMRIGQIAASDAADIEKLAKLGGAPDKAPLRSCVSDFYFTNADHPRLRNHGRMLGAGARGGQNCGGVGRMVDFFWTYIWPLIVIVAQSVLLVVILLVAIAYILLADRKIWAAVQIRRGPNVVGPWGLFQSFADLLKFVVKEPVIPAGANKGVFLLAPLVTCVLALAAWAVIPVNAKLGDRQHQCWRPLHFRDLFADGLRRDHGRLGFELEISVSCRAAFSGANGLVRSLNRLCDHHSPAVRRFVQSLGHCCGAGRKVRITRIGTGCHCFRCSSYFSSRRWPRRTGPPFDLVEAESELVAGFMVEYGSTLYMMFMLGEYVAIGTMCAMATILFLGGWLSPIPYPPFTWIPGVFWFTLKALFFFFLISPWSRPWFHAIATINSCGSAGRSSCRCRWRWWRSSPPSSSTAHWPRRDEVRMR